jgi:hypothetical protein
LGQKIEIIFLFSLQMLLFVFLNHCIVVTKLYERSSTDAASMGLL